MSTIYVWTSEGDWSWPLFGVDKVHFMEQAILDECKEIYSAFDGKWKDFDKSYCFWLEGFRVDEKTIYTKEFIELIDNQWEFKVSKLNEIFSNAKVFEMPLYTLRNMAADDDHLSAAYNFLIEEAAIPSDAPDSYRLLLMFSSIVDRHWGWLCN
jgi:hypothetical protein